ncbi:MAG: DUF721 domain-containing protein [Rhizobiales bacterium]|nr:DciA family protein [Hyphomicrobiales bacterium]NRB13479.1 DUF721 domain-containing protein [Hyphomicrobiales bacterium]
MKKTSTAKTNYKRTHKGLRNISRLAQNIGRKSFKKQGFNGIEIFKQWPYIVGDTLSQYCLPEKINWPRQTQKLDQNDLLGATLVIKCIGAFAPEIQSQMPMILQRANIMFGYEAITKLKLKQVYELDLAEKFEPEPTPQAPETVKKSTSSVKNDGLREALNALGAQIYQKKS